MKGRDGNEWVLVPVNATVEMVTAARYLLPSVPAVCMDDAINRAIAAAPQFVAGDADDAMAMRACARIFGSNVGDGYAKPARDWLSAWRAELGPALGLVELKEPTPEECERICTEYERLLMREGTCGGRDAFDAVRAVMRQKEGL